MKEALKRILTHRRRYYTDRLLNRLSEKRLGAFLADLGVRPGMVLYVQSSFGSLGYYPPGPAGLVDLLCELVGPDGTVVMPSFPFTGTMSGYVASHPEFVVQRTPSVIGALPEALRVRNDTLRSVHPTHPVAAAGQHAPYIVEGHDRSDSPQGPQSPFSRMVELGGSILRIGAGAYPLCHHLQEIVEYPNLFLPDRAALECTADGRSRIVETRVYRPTLPFVLFRDEEGGQPVATNLIDFPYLFAGDREALMRATPELRAVLDHALAVRAEAEGAGTLRRGSVNGCECDLVAMRESLAYAIPEVKRLIERHRGMYEPERLSRALDTGEVRIA